MSNLAIEQIQIEDKSDQLTTTCHLELVSTGAVPAMPSEFSLPGDLSGGLTASNLRPTGQRVNVNLSYGNTPLYTAFTGIIEHVDDMEDADKLTYSMDLSNLPQGYPNRNQVSAIYNQVTPLTGYSIQEPTDAPVSSGTVAQSLAVINSGYYDTTAYSVLSDICGKAGLALGRIDMPDYTLWGVYEVIHKTPVAVAKELCEPFNKFPFFKYLVRCDANGLQIIAFDYTQGAQTSNAHSITNFISKKRTFSIYNPEERIAGANVLCNGGNMYFRAGITPGIGDSTITQLGYTSKVYTSSSNNEKVAELPSNASQTSIKVQNGIETVNSGPLEPQVVESAYITTETGIVYLVTESRTPKNSSALPMPAVDSNLDSCISELQNGTIDDLQINESYVMQVKESTFSSYPSTGGLATYLSQVSTTFNNYTIIQAATGLYANQGIPIAQSVTSLPGSTNTKIVINYTETKTVLFDYAGNSIPQSLTKKYYYYDIRGVASSTITYTYYYVRNQWVLDGIIPEQGDLQAATSTTIQMYNADRKMLETSTNTVLNPGQTVTRKYQLKNGTPVPPLRLSNLALDTTIPVEVQQQILAFSINNAFTMSGPNMDYAGLNLLWLLAQREIQLEQNNAYWDIITLVCPIDTSPVIGESIIVDGSGGLVDSYRTLITADSATTEITIKRIVYNPAGTLQVIPSLAGSYPVQPIPDSYTTGNPNPVPYTSYQNGGLCPINNPSLITF
jgi:hypothetical protein